MQYMYGISWLQYPSILGKIFQCQKSENMMGLTEIIPEVLFGQRTFDDFRTYKENAVNFWLCPLNIFPHDNLCGLNQLQKQILHI